MTHRKKAYELHHSNAKDNKSNKSSVYKGLVLSLLGGIFNSSAAVIVKQLTNLYPGQLAVYRFIVMFALTIPQAVKCKENLLGPKNLRLLLIARAIIGATELFLNYFAFRYLPLGEAAVIQFSNPIFVTIAARLLLNESCGVFQSISVFISIVGIVFSTKIPQRLNENAATYTKESIYGLLCAVGSLILSSSRFIVIRKLKTVHHSVIMLYHSLFGILETAILTALVGDFQMHKCGLQSLYIIFLGVFSYGGQTLITIALQCEMAGPVCTIMAASRIFLAFMWQTLLFHDIPDLYSLIGAVLVGVSVIFVGLQKWVSVLQKDSPYWKKLNWILK